MSLAPPRIALLAALVVLAGCGADGRATQAAAEDPTGSWQLELGTIDGEPIPVIEDHPVTLTISGSELSGTAACNGYGGHLAVTGGTLEISELGMTAMACEDPVMELEAAFVAALERTESIRRTGDTLTLAGRGVEMTFTRLAPPPTADLLGTSWILESIFVGDVATAPAGDPATLTLRQDGTLSGGTGCRTFDGRWVEQANQIVAVELGMNEIECPPELSAQDGQVVSVIGDGFVPTIEGGLLTLTDPGSLALVYRAEE